MYNSSPQDYAHHFCSNSKCACICIHWFELDSFPGLMKKYIFLEANINPTDTSELTSLMFFPQLPEKVLVGLEGTDTTGNDTNGKSEPS